MITLLPPLNFKSIRLVVHEMGVETTPLVPKVGTKASIKERLTPLKQLNRTGSTKLLHKSQTYITAWVSAFCSCDVKAISIVINNSLKSCKSFVLEQFPQFFIAMIHTEQGVIFFPT